MNHAWLIDVFNEALAALGPGIAGLLWATAARLFRARWKSVTGAHRDEHAV